MSSVVREGWLVNVSSYATYDSFRRFEVVQVELQTKDRSLLLVKIPNEDAFTVDKYMGEWYHKGKSRLYGHVPPAIGDYVSIAWDYHNFKGLILEPAINRKPIEFPLPVNKEESGIDLGNILDSLYPDKAKT